TDSNCSRIAHSTLGRQKAADYTQTDSCQPNNPARPCDFKLRAFIYTLATFHAPTKPDGQARCPKPLSTCCCYPPGWCPWSRPGSSCAIMGWASATGALP